MHILVTNNMPFIGSVKSTIINFISTETPSPTPTQKLCVSLLFIMYSRPGVGNGIGENCELYRLLPRTILIFASWQHLPKYIMPTYTVGTHPIFLLLEVLFQFSCFLSQPITLLLWVLFQFSCFLYQPITLFLWVLLQFSCFLSKPITLFFLMGVIPIFLILS